MASLRIEHSGFSIDLDPGARIVDVCDDHPKADVPFSCRAANCGTCRVRVVEGMDAFPQPAEDEQAILDLYSDPPSVRLACQLRIVRDVPRIVLAVVEP